MDPNSPYAALWIVLALIAWPLAFMGVVSLVLGILSVASGWRSLAKRYRAEGTPKGRRVSGMVMMNLVSYQQVVSLRVGEEGLSLSVWLPPKRLHPPLFIPWSDVAECRKTSLVFVEATQLAVGPRRNPILVTGGAGVAIRKEWEAWRARQRGGGTAAAGGAEARALHHADPPRLSGSSLPDAAWLAAQREMPISVPHRAPEPRRTGDGSSE